MFEDRGRFLRYGKVSVAETASVLGHRSVRPTDQITFDFGLRCTDESKENTHLRNRVGRVNGRLR